MSKDKTRWIANARGARAQERFRVVDDQGAPVLRARIEGTWGTPSSNAVTFEGETDTNGVFSVTGVSQRQRGYQNCSIVMAVVRGGSSWPACESFNREQKP